MDEDDGSEPHGELTIRTVAMPADTNPSGDIFGGWVLSQMDIAGGVAARKFAKGRVVTVAVTAMTFIAPVKVGDTLCIYIRVGRVGRTSMVLHVEAWAQRYLKAGTRVLVTQADFVMVALDDHGKPTPIPPEE